MRRDHPSDWASSRRLALLAVTAGILGVHAAAAAQQDPASRPRDEVIAEVRVVGNQRVATQRIMAEIKTRAGVPFDQKLIDDDVRRLVATRLFFDVGVEKVREPIGLVVLFRVLEGNEIRDVVFEGNRAFTSEKLRDKAGLNSPKDSDKTPKNPDGKPKPKLEKTIDIARAKDAARTIEDFYHDKGYPFAQVQLGEGTQPGDRRLVFRVTEGPKVVITDVDFEFLDHETLGARTLATKVKCSPQRFGLFGGKYNGRDIEEDVHKLAAYYRGLGYFDAKVSREIRESDDRAKVTVKFVVYEGKRYNVRDIQFAGNKKLDRDKLLDGLKLKIGEPFNQQALVTDVQKVSDKYGHLGHVEAKVNPDVRFLDKPGEVDVIYQITEGEPYYVGRIFVTGNQTTKDTVVRHALRLYPGELMDTVAMRKSEANLRRTQLFLTSMQTGQGPALNPVGEGPNVRDIDVNVGQEAQTGRILFGVGVNSDAGVIGNIVVSEQNFDILRWPASFSDFLAGDAFRGAGQEFRLEAAPGTQFSRYLLSWREPHIFDSDYSLGLSGHFFQRRYREYDEDRGGGAITIGHEFTDQIRGSIGLRMENVRISRPDVPTPQDLLDVLGQNFLTALTLGVEHDTRDNPFMPTCGHLAALSFEQGFGDFTFPKFTLEGRQYWTITERPDGTGKQIFSLRGTAGFASDDTPLFERFFAGGFRNFRGFLFRGVGPVGTDPATGKDTSTHVGGDFMLLGSAEYQFPLTADDALQLVVFSDFGTVESDVRISEFRATAGFGLRVSVPMLGQIPLAFDFAFPLHKADSDQTQVFSFFIGIFR